ncbi:transposase [Negadavirga shengliensis]|uniref:Transposase n=1 Tax=Negadavirga shengliensis TaxID=1389218 RepID=A0ABV9T4N6_9BACT
MGLPEKARRNSRMEYDQVYFWTDTVVGWKRLLYKNKYKEIILSSWGELVSRGMIAVYGFVIMPNHLHVVWEMKEPNGKEMPHASFNKFTSHLITGDIKTNHPRTFSALRVNEPDRKVRLWQRDPLAILMDARWKVEQKLKYLHDNPLQKHWNLANRPESYQWSSSAFYGTGVDKFGFLTHYMDRF